MKIFIVLMMVWVMQVGCDTPQKEKPVKKQTTSGFDDGFR